MSGREKKRTVTILQKFRGHSFDKFNMRQNGEVSWKTTVALMPQWAEMNASEPTSDF